MIPIFRVSIGMTIALFAFNGCTSTEVHTFRSKELIGKYYDNILLVVDVPSASDRFFAEQAFSIAFEERGLNLFTATDIIPSIRKLSGEQLSAILEKQDIHCILTITPAEALEIGNDNKNSKRFTSSMLQWANELIYYDNPSPIFPNDENLYSGDYGKFSLKLFDMETGKVAWLGVSITEKTGFGTFENLMKHNARETVNKLISEKLIVPLIVIDK